MSNIKPFKAVHYNTDKIEEVSLVVSPPYDVISSEEQDELHQKSANNFTHIDLSKDKPRDNRSDNKYTRSKKIFNKWLKDKIMIEDKDPCIYFYKQDYKVKGQKYSRLGFISLMELFDDEEDKVYPHENTHSNAVNDRLRLTRALRSNLSCIFVCYSDKERQVEKIFNKNLVAMEPLFDVEDDNKVRNRLWKIDDPKVIKDINRSIEGQNIFVADGHHRYEVARKYREIQVKKRGNLQEDDPYNFVMTYFTNLDSQGLQILPMHRIVKSFPEDINFLEEMFRIDKVKSTQELQILLAKAGRNEHAFGLYTRKGIKLLRLKNKLLIQENIKEGSQEYKSLDATILKCLVLDKLGIPSDDNITYTKNLDDVTNMVDSKQADAGFVMNPVKISQLKAVALNGERMPPKTTYFYPKVLSGLTVYKME